MATNMTEGCVQIITRLDQIQREHSQMIKRLDTVQNILESQSQKQSSMEGQLSEMAIKLEQDKIFMKDQLRDAQNEILERLQFIHPLPGGALHVKSLGLFDTSLVSDQGTQTEGTCCGSHVIVEVNDKLQSLEQKTELIKDEVIETKQTCRRLSRQIETILERNIIGLAAQERESLLTSVAEISSIPDVIRGHMRAEHIWLVEQVDRRLSESDTVVIEKLSILDGEMIEQADQTRQMIEQADQTRLMTYMLDQQKIKFSEKLDKYQGQMTDILTKTTKKLKEDILKHVTSCEETRADNLQNVKVELDHVETSVSSLREIADKMETNMSAAVQKLHILQTSVTAGQQTVREDLVAIKQQQDNTTEKLEKTIQEVKDDVDRVKRQMFSVIEKESQLVRDRIQGPLPSLGKYTFDFYIENFETLVRSEKYVDSLHWHINEMRSCVKGLVCFYDNGDLRVWLVHGRHPREVGLQPGTTSVILKIKATICDINKKTLPDVRLGEKSMPMSVSDIPCNGECGCQIGVMSCDDLITKGYGDKEGYEYKSLLIRFDVTVC